MPTSRHLGCDPACHHAASRACRERGFGLVEIVVVVLILFILSTVLISSFSGSKRTTYFRSAVASANIYGEAVEAYMADNGQRAPVMGDPVVWPQASIASGPRDRMLETSGQKRPYILKGAPEPVQNGVVALGPKLDAAAARSQFPQARAYISYEVLPDGSTYELRVTTLDRSDEKPMQCIITNGATLPAAGEGTSSEPLKRC